jgi:5'-3' exonuclease
VVQVQRKSNQILDAGAVRQKYGVEPARIPDFLALVGDVADGYPGIDGIGKTGAARLVSRYGALEDFPPEVLGERRAQALLFKNLATLRTDAALFGDVDELRWRGPTPSFDQWVQRLGDQRLLARCASAAQNLKRGQDPFS